MPKFPPASLAVLAVAWAAWAACGPVAAQSPLRVGGLGPGGLRMSVTERWGEVSFTVWNDSDASREARVAAYYEGGEDAQYARDLWVPARSALTAWMSVGPVPKVGPGGKPFSTNGRRLYFSLFDRTDGTSKIVRPAGDDKLRERAVLYREKTDWTTALFTDEPVPDVSSFAQPTPDQEAAEAVRVMRGLRRHSEFLSLVRDPSLPSTQESYDGIDEIVLACNHLKRDPHGRAALRQWVERGGQLWVMLDQVEGDLLGSLLGEECAPQVVDRTSLSAVRIQRASPTERREAIGTPGPAREYERPVNFVRVALTGRETVHQYVDAWPAAFSIRVGRGRILVTTLGPRGWTRPRGFSAPVATGGPRRPPAPVKDPPSPFPRHEDLPVALDHFLELYSDLKPPERAFAVDELRPMLLDEIGYTVPGRGTVAAILGAFVAALAGIGLILRRSRRTERVGWLAPAAAVVAAGAFYLFGGATRHSIPPTAAIAELAEAIPGSGEIARIGVFASYQPTAGPLRLAGADGVIDFDFDGLDGQDRLRVQTDRDAWHYEKLSVPAGVRQGTYRTTVTGSASAIASFGPDGLRGKLAVQGFRDPADAILVARNREAIGARFAADGTFSIGMADALERGEFLAGTVFSDRQQRRQAVYRKLVGNGLPDHYDDRDFLMAWTAPDAIPFQSNDGSRAIGSTLLSVPVEYVRPPAGTKVAVPRAFLPFRRWIDGRPRTPTFDSSLPIDMELRFQLPASVVPMTVERATVVAKVRAPSRRVTLNGYAGGAATKLIEVASPIEPIRLEIVDPRYLKLDDTGGLHVGIAFSGNAGSGVDAPWSLESVQLELSGQTTAAK